MRRHAAFGSLLAVLVLAPTARADEATARPGSSTQGTPRTSSVVGRIHSRAKTTWIWEAPDTGSRRLGFVRIGASIRVRGSKAIAGRGCSSGFYAVEPRGYVCNDRTVTASRSYRYVRALREHQPRAEALPFSYAISNGAPMYRRLPAPSEWKHAERNLGRAGTYEKYSWNERHERLAEVRSVEPQGSTPWFLVNGGSARAEKEKTLVRMIAPLGTLIAYTLAFRHEHRVWLVTPDGFVVPADRVRPYRASRFHGVRLDDRNRLPMAAVGLEGSLEYARADDGTIESSGIRWPAGSWLSLASVDAISENGTEYYEVADRKSGRTTWVSSEGTTIFERVRRPRHVSPRQKWIDVGVTDGTLVAYVGERPVFATLISPGAGGVSRQSRDPVKASTTPRGTYRIQYKYLAQTMSPQKDKPETERTFWIAEVPWVQYFRIPFAIHGAYWHENFGEWMSGGCVNVSPEDGRFLFGWTEPALPPDWDAVWAGGDNGPGTVVVIRR